MKKEVVYTNIELDEGIYDTFTKGIGNLFRGAKAGKTDSSTSTSSKDNLVDLHGQTADAPPTPQQSSQAAAAPKPVNLKDLNLFFNLDDSKKQNDILSKSKQISLPHAKIIQSILLKNAPAIIQQKLSNIIPREQMVLIFQLFSPDVQKKLGLKSNTQISNFDKTMSVNSYLQNLNKYANPVLAEQQATKDVKRQAEVEASRTPEAQQQRTDALKSRLQEKNKNVVILNDLKTTLINAVKSQVKTPEDFKNLLIQISKTAGAESAKTREQEKIGSQPKPKQQSTSKTQPKKSSYSSPDEAMLALASGNMNEASTEEQKFINSLNNKNNLNKQYNAFLQNVENVVDNLINIIFVKLKLKEKISPTTPLNLPESMKNKTNIFCESQINRWKVLAEIK